MTYPDEFEEDCSEEDIPNQFREDFSQEDEARKDCPSCGNEISEEAIRCLFCGRHVPVHSGLLGFLNHRAFRIFGILGLTAALVGIFAWVFL